MLRRLEVTDPIENLLKQMYMRKHIFDLEVHEIKVDGNTIDIVLDLQIDDGLGVAATLQVDLDDNTTLSKLLQDGVAEKLAKKAWFELDPHGSQDHNVALINRHLAVYGLHLVQGHEVGGAGSAALKLCVEQLPTKEKK